MNLALAVALFTLAAFFTLGAAWLACAALSADTRGLRMACHFLTVLTAVVAAVLVTAGVRLR